MSAFRPFFDLSKVNDIALGLSGGPDSMSLMHMLHSYVEGHGLETKIHALTVNHNLREDSREEAEQVKKWLSQYSHASHHILDWDHAPQETRLMEQARQARYSLLEKYCQSHKISALFVAHHMDDQVETFLFRLSKGSGLDGLCGMREEYIYSPHLKIYRPLLRYTKQDLLDYCAQQCIPYVTDPSNEKTEYARPRLRKSREALEKEGLTAKRISLTTKRLHRARDTLYWLTEKATQEVCNVLRDQVMVDLNKLSEYPAEIHFRVLQNAIHFLTQGRNYAPRMEKIEDIAEEMIQETSFRKRTFAGLIFEKKLADGSFYMQLTKER